MDDSHTRQFGNAADVMTYSSDSDRKAQILNLVKQFPGIRYRELLRMTGLSNGVLTHHLKGMEECKAIRTDRQSGSTRYYPSDISENEYNLLPFIRHDVTRQILLFILDHDLCTFSEIVEHTKNFPSTISSHLKRLREARILHVHYGERHQMYRIVNREVVIDVLAKYRASFVDKAVDSYVNFIDEI